MFREPIGEYAVGSEKYDTGFTGEGIRKRRIPVTFFYPETEPDIRCPVILCNHGLKGNDTENTVLCLDLASSGYAVFCIGHPYGASKLTYADGTEFEDPTPFEEIRFRLDTVEPLWYEDILTAIGFIKEMGATDPKWKNRLMIEDMGVVGVSFGGCCSVTAALKNKELTYAVNLDGSMFVEPEYIFPDKPILVMCSPFNHKAHAGLVAAGCTNVRVEKIKKVSHFEFSDGIYLTKKGRNNREWADRISKQRAELILDFIKQTKTY